MRICTNEATLLKFYDKIVELKNKGFEKQEIDGELAVEAFRENIANFQLRNLIDTAFLEKKQL